MVEASLRVVTQSDTRIESEPRGYLLVEIYVSSHFRLCLVDDIHFRLVGNHPIPCMSAKVLIIKTKRSAIALEEFQQLIGTCTHHEVGMVIDLRWSRSAMSMSIRTTTAAPRK